MDQTTRRPPRPGGLLKLEGTVGENRNSSAIRTMSRSIGMNNNRTTTAPLLVLPFLVAALITYPQPRDLQQRNENHDLILTIISVYNDQGGLIADLNKSVFTMGMANWQK